MCTQKPPHDHSENLYARYKQAFQVYIEQRVLPSQRDHHDEHLLKQLKQRWDNHKVRGAGARPAGVGCGVVRAAKCTAPTWGE